MLLVLCLLVLQVCSGEQTTFLLKKKNKERADCLALLRKKSLNKIDTTYRWCLNLSQTLIGGEKVPIKQNRQQKVMDNET